MEEGKEERAAAIAGQDGYWLCGAEVERGNDSCPLPSPRAASRDARGLGSSWGIFMGIQCVGPMK
jgi:hypothetical protein